MSSSLWNGPYASAVSMWVTPSSSARWMVRIDSASSNAPSAVYVPDMLIAPRPSRPTSRVPRCAFFMMVPCLLVVRVLDVLLS